MKKVIFVIISLILCVLLSGCVALYGNADTSKQDTKINSDFTPVPNNENLYYCNDTKIVYWIGGSYQVNMIGDDYTTSYMVAYFAPNGKPYIYNEITKELCEIE